MMSRVGTNREGGRWPKQKERCRRTDAGLSAVDLHGPAASAEQIAEVAGVSRTVLYRYFKDKDDLRQASSDLIVGRVITSVMPHLVLDAESTPRDVITSTASTIIGWF